MTRERSSSSGLARAAFLLVAGRSVGFIAVFAIPVVLARVFAPAEFGIYKKLFLLFSTLFGMAQLGMAESLYYFVPRHPDEAGRHVGNTLAALTLSGLVCVTGLYVFRHPIAARMNSPELADYLFLLGALLALMLMTTILEIVMITRNQHLTGAITYAGSDMVRALLFVVAAVGFRSIRGVLLGAVVFAALRVAWMLIYLWRDWGLLRSQLAYSLPFALAVGIEVLQFNLHQYIVASWFDAATFVFYTVGCLNIPIVDLLMTSSVNVMMVKMAEEARADHAETALALFHETVKKLSLVFFPLTVLLAVCAHQVIVTLFTTRYLPSVPIFAWWTLTILPASFAVDGVLRVYAQTRYLLVMNIVRIAVIAGLAWPCLSWFGLVGAVLINVVAGFVVKGMGVVRISRVLQVPMSRVLPWGTLAGIAARALVAGIPAFWITRTLALPPLAVAICAGIAFAISYGALVYPTLGWDVRSWVGSRRPVTTGGLSPETALPPVP